jgi:hypothetical protein
MGKNNKFIQKTHMKQGTFTKYCKSKGFKGVNTKCIEKGTHSKNSHVVKMANFAKTLRRLPEPKHK